MELHAVDGQLAVAHAHQHAAAVRRRLEHGRQRRPPRRRASGSAPRSAGPAGPAYSARAVVVDLRRLAVHGHVADHPAAERLRRATGGPGRRPSVGRPPAGSGASPRSRCPPRRACRARARRRPGRARASSSSSTRGRVVADRLDLRPELAQVLDEVVGEGVVVVDHEDAHVYGHSACRVASSMARDDAARLAPWTPRTRRRAPRRPPCRRRPGRARGRPWSPRCGCRCRCRARPCRRGSRPRRRRPRA